ncbi:copper chaperone PCu(A)C [Eionea flava]
MTLLTRVLTQIFTALNTSGANFRQAIFQILTGMATASLLFFSINTYAHDHSHAEHTNNQEDINTDSLLHINHVRVNPVFSGMPVTAAYFTIHNRSEKNIRLVAVKGDISDRIEIHEHTMSNGLMKMQKVANGIELPAEETVKFTPGGYHIMIMNLDQAITESDEIELTLIFSDKSEKTITAIAKKPSHHGHGEHKENNTHKHH